jgi:hypothetical protein
MESCRIFIEKQILLLKKQKRAKNCPYRVTFGVGLAEWGSKSAGVLLSLQEKNGPSIKGRATFYLIYRDFCKNLEH